MIYLLPFISHSWSEVKKFAEDLVNSFDVSSSGTHVGIVQFSEVSKIEVPLEGDKSVRMIDVSFSI